MAEKTVNFNLNCEIEPPRFVSYTNDDIAKLVENRHSKNTKKSTNRCVNLFREYLIEKGESAAFENFDKDKLKGWLRRFYVEARRKDVSDYRKSSIQNLKHGLRRYLMETCNLDIRFSCGIATFFVCLNLFAATNK